MNKKELVREVSRRTRVTRGETRRIVEEFMAAMRRALSDGRRVELRRFGAFDLRHRRARTLRNPRNGKVYRVPGKVVPVFRAARELSEVVRRPAAAAGTGRTRESG
jgi:nucleoid DNA-binding protein